MDPTNPRQEVVIKDIEMSFGSMVVFMVKWTIAAIPAFLILLLIVLAAGAIIRGSLFRSGAETPSASAPQEDAKATEARREEDLYFTAFEMCADSAQKRTSAPPGRPATRQGTQNVLQSGTTTIFGSLSRERNGSMISIDFECDVARSGDRVRIGSVRIPK